MTPTSQDTSSRTMLARVRHGSPGTRYRIYEKSGDFCFSTCVTPDMGITIEQFLANCDRDTPQNAPHSAYPLVEAVAMIDTEHVVHVACSRALVELLAAESEPVTMKVVVQDGIAEMVFTRYTPPEPTGTEGA